MMESGLSIAKGFVFRPVLEKGLVLFEWLAYTAVYDRLKYYLTALGIDDGETPHSLRHGCAITLSLSVAGKPSGGNGPLWLVN